MGETTARPVTGQCPDCGYIECLAEWAYRGDRWRVCEQCGYRAQMPAAGPRATEAP